MIRGRGHGLPDERNSCPADGVRVVMSRRSVLLGLTVAVAAASWPKGLLWGQALSPRPDQCRPPAELAGRRPPYLVRFRYDGGREIYFLAARHSVERESPTHVLVRNLLESVRPGSLVVEGMVGDPPQVDPDTPQLFERGIYPENRYAQALAAERGIRTVGGDLAPTELARVSLESGFRADDLLGAHVLRVLSAQLTPGRTRAVEDMVKRDFVGVMPTDGFDFDAWFLARFGEPVSETAISRAYRGPCGSGIVAEIISFETNLRNRNLLSVLMRERAQHERTAVLFGTNHLYALYGDLAAGAVEHGIVPCGDGERGQVGHRDPPSVAA